jgi:hypothetical protein
MTALRDTPATTHDPLYSVETLSGGFVDLSNPLPEQFDLNSIASGLAKVCRFAAQIPFHYSVAEHAYWVSKRLEWLGHDVAVQLAGLHHDDPEHVMCDITAPMKRWLALHTDALETLEASLMAAIIPGLGFYPGEIDIEHPAVHAADQWARAGEALVLTRSGGRGWTGIQEYDPHPDLSTIGLSTERAAALWTARHHELFHKLRHAGSRTNHV